MSLRCPAGLPFLLLAAAALLAAGCADPAPRAESAEAAPPAPAGDGPIVIPAPPENAGTGPAALSWQAPDRWIAETPASTMRRAQYRISGPGGDAELVVYYFGPGQGGDPMANVQRWAHQFTQPDGSPSFEAMQVTDLEGTAVPVKMVEVTGTYTGGMGSGPGDAMDNAMLLGAIASGPDAPWFFKMTGPEATVRSEREAFIALLRGVRAGS
ncbi:MAG: hypothetical protein Q9Q40_11245 [Acidobacteriota bacterium]|nr:hypothetical protein [Acidobacteriota bacterium]MDQ7086956.1 hypothetical protein [Acidobacteriota bacterium]